MAREHHSMCVRCHTRARIAGVIGSFDMYARLVAALILKTHGSFRRRRFGTFNRGEANSTGSPAVAALSVGLRTSPDRIPNLGEARVCVRRLLSSPAGKGPRSAEDDGYRIWRRSRGRSRGAGRGSYSYPLLFLLMPLWKDAVPCRKLAKRDKR